MKKIITKVLTKIFCVLPKNIRMSILYKVYITAYRLYDILIEWYHKKGNFAKSGEYMKLRFALICKFGLYIDFEKNRA